MNWLERARCEIGETSLDITANSADGNPTAGMAALAVPTVAQPAASTGSNGSAPRGQWPTAGAMCKAFELQPPSELMSAKEERVIREWLSFVDATGDWTDPVAVDELVARAKVESGVRKYFLESALRTGGRK